MGLKDKIKDVWKKVSDLEGGEEKAESTAAGKGRIPYKVISQKLKEIMKENVDVVGRKIILPGYYIIYFNEADRKLRMEVEDVFCEELKEELYHEMRKINPEQNKHDLTIRIETDASLPGGQFRIEHHIKAPETIGISRQPTVSFTVPKPEAEMETQKTLVEQPLPPLAEEEPKTVVQKIRKPLYKLLIDSGTEKTEQIIEKETIAIGRGSKDDVMLQSPDFSISRSHATLSFTAGSFTLLPKGVNGTFLNGVELELNKPVLISPGDEIKIMNYTIKVVLES